TAGGAGGGTAGGAGGGTAGGAGGGTAGGAGGGTAGGAGGGTAGGAGGGTGGGAAGCASTFAAGACATPTDLTAATSPSFNFSSLAFNGKACIKVKTTQTVSITGISGTSHPTSAQDCGPANVLTAHSTDFMQQFTVTGTYGFHCSNHAGMELAIQVVP
ncbi:MAG: hypothetical protein H6Q89_967, partial [Myxococcaceae bacterium]|nr:hypothetical protein [Myxococcaceae bacterium]